MSDRLPNPITTPPWWQLSRWIADPLGFLDRHYRTHGDMFVMSLTGFDPIVILSNPKAIRELFSQDAKFDSGRGNTIAEPLVGRNSLTLMDGDRHRRERKLLMPPFHGERLQTYARQICAIAAGVTSQWQVGQPFVARSAMQSISLEVILQVVFGLSAGERHRQLKSLLVQWLDMTDSPLRSSMLFLKFLQKDWGTSSPWGRMKQRQREIHTLLQAEIERRRAQSDWEGTDILSLMMAARDEGGRSLTDVELRDELLTLLFAGHETTAVILAWALYQIQRNSTVRAQLLQELDELGECPSPLDIARLPYLTAVCQEVLRMYPVTPVLFPRIAKSPVQIGGYSFAPETTFMTSAYLVHYREELYPQPKEFKPERFLDRQYAPEEYMPFGGGSRRCLGYALAQLEIKLVLATILSEHQLALAEEKPVKPHRRGFVLAPAGGVRMQTIGKRGQITVKI